MADEPKGKQKAARIPLDYYKGLDWLRWVVAPAVFVATVAFALVSQFWKDSGRSWTSPGPVHSVHSAWEIECEACHVPNQPTNTDNPLFASWNANRAAGPDRCQTCHEGSIHQAHHANQKPEEVAHCGSCHREHRGREASLTLLADATCTSCHANLTNHVTGSGTAYHATITSFAKDHPEFHLGSPEKRQPAENAGDPGMLKFNHQLHLTRGLKYKTDDKREWTFADIQDKDARERYRSFQGAGPENDTAVKLDCAACHQLDGGDTPLKKSLPQEAFLGRNALGAYMAPINFEKHCQACHPLTFDGKNATETAAIPHGLQPTEVRRFLWGRHAEWYVRDGGVPAPSSRPLPGKELTQEEKKAREAIEGRVSSVEQFLYQDDLRRSERYLYSDRSTCTLCHKGEWKQDDLSLSQVTAPNIPEVWFPHAAFNHLSHRAMACQECHPNAETSAVSTNLLLPGIKDCKKCHNSQTASATPPPGEVRSSCVTCHRYHGGDRPDQGLGSRLRGVERRLTLKEFLAGDAQPRP